MNKNNNIRIISTKITGTSHKTNKEDCQDFFKYYTSNDFIIAIVSDGAGSAKYGQIGAEIICETIINNLSSIKHNNIKKEIIKNIKLARKKLESHPLTSEEYNLKISDFSATFVGLVYKNNSGFFFHIGDGAGIALYDDVCNNYVLSSPMNGEYSCETFFYTMPNWQDYLRFTPINKSKSLILMTDGVTDFAINKHDNALIKGFIEPINNYLTKEIDTSKAQNALQNTLDSKQAKHLNSDDKTFLWIGLNND